MKTLAKKTTRKTPPTLVNGTVRPKRQKNVDLRSREYLTVKEIERLTKVAKSAERRYGLAMPP